MNFAVIQNFNLFDIIIALIVGFFSLRGLRRGLTKEGLSMIGLLLGLFFASRLMVESSDFIQEYILKISNTSTLEFVSFLFVFLIIWFSGMLLGAIFGKLESANGISFINRLFGFAVGGAKSFFIITILTGIVSEKLLDAAKIKRYTSNSFVYPYMDSLGRKIGVLNSKRKHKKEEVSIGVPDRISDKNSSSNAFLQTTKKDGHE